MKAQIDQVTPGANVVALAGATPSGAIPTGTGYVGASASFTRPNNTTAYAASQLIANDTVAGNVVPLVFDLSASAKPGSIWTIIETRIRVAGLTVLMTSGITLHTFTAPPVPTVGDGGALIAANTLAVPAIATYMGQPAIASTALVLADGSIVYGGSSAAAFVMPANCRVYGLLMANNAWTPNASAVVTVELVLRP